MLMCPECFNPGTCLGTENAPQGCVHRKPETATYQRIRDEANAMIDYAAMLNPEGIPSANHEEICERYRNEPMFNAMVKQITGGLLQHKNANKLETRDLLMMLEGAALLLREDYIRQKRREMPSYVCNEKGPL